MSLIKTVGVSKFFASLKEYGYNFPFIYLFKYPYKNGIMMEGIKRIGFLQGF